MLSKLIDEIKQHMSPLVTKIIGLFFLLALVIIIARIIEGFSLKQQTIESSIPTVAVLTVKAGEAIEDIILPGNIQAWHDAVIYARTNGYIKKWYVDIGSHVKAGELLAEIESPEIDAQYRQSEADLNTAIANNALAQSTAKRWQNLLKSASVSKQETDEKVSQAKALAAVEIASRANRDRLKELVSFEKVVAPFDGVIVSRSTDVGALISAGSSTSGVPLFQISQTNPLRVYVKIPQAYVSKITPNMTVTLSVPEYPNRSFQAKLISTAKAVDPSTRTLLVQFEANNDDEKLLAGSYAQVKFAFVLSKQAVTLPINTLLFRKEGLQVATLDKDNKVVLKSVKIKRDLGNIVEIIDNLESGDRVIINPPDSILAGEQVRVKS